MMSQLSCDEKKKKQLKILKKWKKYVKIYNIYIYIYIYIYMKFRIFKNIIGL